MLARFHDMRAVSLTSLILLATVSAPLAAPYRIDSRHHQEGRPDAATLVPPDWRLQRDEQRYVSPDGSSWFAPHASSVGSEPIARHMDRIARQEGGTVTYFRREPDWIAVSGFKAGRIFYRKAVLACGGKVWHHIEFEYPAALKRRMDPFVNRASYSIDHAETTDCREPRRRSRPHSHFLKRAFSSSIFSDASALVRLSSKWSGRWACSHNVLR